MVVYPNQIKRHLEAELPFMATEKILMEAVTKGKSRQDMHEIIKIHAVAAGLAVKQEGGENDLLLRLANDKEIPFSLADLEQLIGSGEQFAGRAKEQTEEYLQEIVYPLLKKNIARIGNDDAALMV
jgi:adenylosuccinate lyase